MKIKLVCENCGEDFLRSKGEINRNNKIGRRIYCSRSCSGKGKFTTGFKSNVSGLNRGYDKKDEHTPFKYYMKILNNKDRQKKGVSITLEDLKSLWEEQGGKCPFTGYDLILRTHNNCGENLTPCHASVDRIDNTQGYVKGNIRFVGVMANYARNKFTDAQLINFCCDVAEKYTGREV